MKRLTIFVGICTIMWWALTFGASVYVFTEVQEFLVSSVDEIMRNMEQVLR